MNVIVTGDVCAGKTTVCNKVIDALRKSGFSCGGIITLKIPNDSLAVMDIQSGEAVTLAIPGDKYGGPLVPKFTFDPEGIAFGLRAIENGTLADILFVDEIGLIEAMGEGFIRALDIINQNKGKPSIIVIREEMVEYLVPGFHDEPILFNTSGQNRNSLPADIISLIRKKPSS